MAPGFAADVEVVIVRGEEVLFDVDVVGVLCEVEDEGEDVAFPC